MTGRIVNGDIVIERGVYSPRADAIGDGKQAEQIKRGRHRESKQRHGGQQYAGGCDPPGPKRLVKKSEERLDRMVPQVIIMEMTPA